MQITLPKEPKVKKTDQNRAVFEIENCYPGYGVTLGNAFRRVLLSSLPGTAVVGIKIKGVQHEFSTLPHVSEDVIDIILNLKKIRFKMVGEERALLHLKASGKKEVTAGDIKTPGNVEVVNKDQLIATLNDKKAELEIEIEVEKGLGFVPVEGRKKEKLEIGAIALDAIYTPIKKVNVEVVNMRVGDRTDFNKLIVDIETDGSVTPQDAFSQAAKILVDQFKVFTTFKKEETGKIKKEKDAKKTAGKKDPKEKIEEVKGFSTRTVNALQAAGIKTVAGLAKKNREFFQGTEGLGEKGIKEVEKILKKFGLEMKE